MQFVEYARIDVGSADHETDYLVFNGANVDGHRVQSSRHFRRPLFLRPASVQSDGSELDARQNVRYAIDVLERPSECLSNKNNIMLNNEMTEIFCLIRH